jgi:hypothetical protein
MGADLRGNNWKEPAGAGEIPVVHRPGRKELNKGETRE